MVIVVFMHLSKQTQGKTLCLDGMFWIT
uniref:Uncharacterized protein n=1 Tax=Rhizophora mucronata TaxID=61149 RepID=A0A2P2NJC5_RHIMU